MMSDAFMNHLVNGEIKNQTIRLFIDYPIGEAKLRGTFEMIHIRNPAPQLISDLVFSFIERIEARSLKRVRDPSPEVKHQTQEVLRKIKPKVAKKKNPKQIGSKII